MIAGSCLCGAVTWELDGRLDNATHCHCSMCRKAHGAPFATYAWARTADVRRVSGADAVVVYASSPGALRAFCGECGSVVPHADERERMEVPLGGLDGDPGVRPEAHIFATSKAPWHIVADNLPQHARYDDPAYGADVPQPPRHGRSGGLHGSCLCGDVAYAVSGPIAAVHNCHCSRCRKARAAAHTTNGFVAIDGVAFLSGQDRLKTYRLPSARYFAQTFCTRCGSAMPRSDPGRRIASIPFGSLDSDPGRGADDHIFVASMAPWYAIADDLPRFDGAPA